MAENGSESKGHGVTKVFALPQSPVSKKTGPKGIAVADSTDGAPYNATGDDDHGSNDPKRAQASPDCERHKKPEQGAADAAYPFLNGV